MTLMAVLVKTSLILTLGILAAFALRRRSAAVRHWILLSALFCAAATPIVGLLTPSWSMPAISTAASRSGSAVKGSGAPSWSVPCTQPARAAPGKRCSSQKLSAPPPRRCIGLLASRRLGASSRSCAIASR